MAQVNIGADPYQRSAIFKVINPREVSKGRFGTDRDGYEAVLAASRKHPTG